MKIYLMATPCSGKTAFAGECDRNRGLRVVDFSPLHEKGSSRGDYYDQIVAYLREQDGPLCVLGRRGPEDVQILTGFTLGVVMPSLEEHRRNSRARERDDPKSRWVDFAEIELARDRLHGYAKQHDIPVFSSFSAALDTLFPVTESD